MELVLNTHGASLRRDNSRFVISNTDGKQVLPPDGIKSIVIGRGASISSDAALLAIEHGIDVVFIDGLGTPLGRLWSVKYGSISDIRRKQLDFSFSPHSVTWIKDVIARKMDNQMALLFSAVPFDLQDTLNVKGAVNRISDYRKKLMQVEGFIVSDISASVRGWEGAASKQYFAVIGSMLPPEFQFTGRTQHPATDWFNCLLNYGYGMLYGKVEGALIKAGVDPYIGVLHRDDYNRPVLAYDVIELLRVWIDYVVIHLSLQKAFSEDCFSTREDGSIWLESLGRRILIQSVNDYLSEVISMNGLERSRTTHIELYAHGFARYLLDLKIQ